MSVDLPEPIAAYIAAENGHDTEAVARCFADNAVVRDEGRTIKGLAAIKQWKAETKKKYQHTVEPLESAQKDGKTSLRAGSPEISPAARSRSLRCGIGDGGFGQRQLPLDRSASRPARSYGKRRRHQS